MKENKAVRILIIDDDAVMRELLNEALEPEGYTLASANNGATGIRLHEEEPFDLIITDIIMPDKGAWGRSGS